MSVYPTSTVLSRRSFLTASAGMLAANVAVCPAAFSDEEPTGPIVPAAPKYIFLFIGDGMGATQVQLASFYKGVLENNGASIPSDLGFTAFPHVGSVTTYDSSSFCPDSASTATSIATGCKTLSGTINMDPETLTVPFETIAEKLHAQLGYRVGILTTVNMNHATPAAFYAHQASRKNYYEIGEELVASGFEYFAGGAFLEPTGPGEDRTHLLDLARAANYTVCTTAAEAEGLSGDCTAALVISEVVADGDAMNYSMDATEGEWRFSDYVRKGIEVLGGAGDKPAPFFMMAESGKIDWACHANDAAASIHDVLEMDSAVRVAVDFYNEHPEDTLILVTADHETGGLAIGYKTTDYDTFLANLAKQTVSYAKFDTDYVKGYIERQTSFVDALADVKACFGIMACDDADAAGQPEAGVDGSLVMTPYELEQLQEAYKRTLLEGASTQGEMTQEDYELYGTYQPFSMCICHLLSRKSGVDHTTYAHTGAPVNLYALGCGSGRFDGAYDNVQIYEKLASLTGVN